MKGIVDDPAMIGQDVVVRFTLKEYRLLPKEYCPIYRDFSQSPATRGHNRKFKCFK